MDAGDIRSAYLKFYAARGHTPIGRASLVPRSDPTTLFNGSGMQQLLPYLLGAEHPDGNRLVDSQPCVRVQDIEEVGDNRHTTFFEMLGNWSLGDYFKAEQIPWFWEFLTEVVGLDPSRIYVSCFAGDESNGIPKDTESAAIWQALFEAAEINAERVDLGTEHDGGELGNHGARIAFYGGKNWWCRAGAAEAMPVGEPGGPDSEVFYLYPDVVHDGAYGKFCHQNCDCGRYIELGNSVFMQYVRTEGGFATLPRKNVDYGGGLERIAAAAIDSPDVFRSSLLWPIVEQLSTLTGKSYDTHTTAMRVLADHLRGAVFLAVDGVLPSNKEQGYVLRRLVRRATRFAFELGVEENFLHKVVPTIADLYRDAYPELADRHDEVVAVLVKEEKAFRQTLRRGLRELVRMSDRLVTGDDLFVLYDTYGFPVELSVEEARSSDIALSEHWRPEFERCMRVQRERSRAANKMHL
ncbi:alanine--tRNA ligase-related protein [Rhodococcus sp. G-MC3]|uniref:alanine--tRNA ligase-related protein n=1 Tax=Rhodococcus sp. G-MC3 TaxID=3046209 RepID=UPI0024B9E870|nr:alanine--tRNA ligase-related protein [Rhodococcus sp. G-MC3]MDJ0395000.1 alanine--tRNA ligase-related protein [Rhodococcus sp. G-MC3]